MRRTTSDAEARLRAYFKAEVEAAAKTTPTAPPLPARPLPLLRSGPRRELRGRAARSDAPIADEGSARRIYGAGPSRAGLAESAASLFMAACLVLGTAAAFPRVAGGRLALSIDRAGADGRFEDIGRDLAKAATLIWESSLEANARD